MIAVTKEFKQMLQELFNSRGVTEIATAEIVDLIDVSLEQLESLLNDETLKKEFKIIQVDEGNYYVKRLMLERIETKKIAIPLKIRWDDIGGCPCFTCYELEKCDIGNPISSIDCPLFSKWLFAEPKKEET